MQEENKTLDHFIFSESIRFIKEKLGHTGLDPLQQQVLERLIHTSGDFSIQSLLKFSPDSCQLGISCIRKGSLILTDTTMAASAIAPMAARTSNSSVRSVLDWAPAIAPNGLTRTALGMEIAWKDQIEKGETSEFPIVVIGSSPTALNSLIDLVSYGYPPPGLIIGMPVGFIGVLESKRRLSKTDLPNILLEGSKGGAALAAATVNALLRAFIMNSDHFDD